MTDKDRVDKNPFLNPGRHTDPDVALSDRIGFLYGSLFFSLFLSIILLAAVIYLYTFQTTKPYIVEVDELGRASYMGEIKDLSSGELDKFVPQYLSRLTEWWRSITPDNVKKKNEINNLLCMVDNGSGFRKEISDYLSNEEENPFKLGNKIIKGIDVKTVLKSGEKTWISEWVETTRKHDGKMVGDPSRYRANIIIGYGESDSDPNCRNVNPFGIYVKNVSWARIK